MLVAAQLGSALLFVKKGFGGLLLVLACRSADARLCTRPVRNFPRVL